MGCKSVDCQKIQEWVFLYVDHEMKEELLLRFQQHLSECPSCAAAMVRIEAIIMIVRKSAPRPAPSKLKKKILAGMPHRRTIPVR